MNILCLFPTPSLLQLALTCRRIHDIILRIIHNRLLAAANISGHQVVLECFHPSTKHSTPYYICEYLGTDHIGTDAGVQEGCTLGQLRDLYSHFRPVEPEGERKVWALHPVSGWRATTLNAFRENTGGLVSEDVELESYEQFSQLQSMVKVVKVGPSRGVFQSCVTISEGLTRVWRNWLAEQARHNESLDVSKPKSNDDCKARLLWSSMNQHTGLRFYVTKKKERWCSSSTKRWR